MNTVKALNMLKEICRKNKIKLDLKINKDYRKEETWESSVTSIYYPFAIRVMATNDFEGTMILAHELGHVLTGGMYARTWSQEVIDNEFRASRWALRFLWKNKVRGRRFKAVKLTCRECLKSYKDAVAEYSDIRSKEFSSS